MVLLAGVVYEDFRERAVHLWLFPLLIAAALCHDTVHFEWEHLLINLTVLLIQLLVLTTYFSFKHKQIINITQTYLGWGDILFWLVLCCLFSPLNFIVFYMSSLCLAVVGSLLIPVFRAEGSRIPLAGMQALLLVLFLAFAHWSNMALRNDDHVLEWLLI
ncbi:MAG: type leader peptidase [Cytophagaceae bacterium]|jgi:hypothetical protein|nr:type leader peptidase [Cytophagaceae bacterium]